MYRSSSDALMHLLSGSVSRVIAKSGSMQNGITYCVVQVTLAGGEEFRIEDYGQEAEELCRAARGHPAIACLQ